MQRRSFLRSALGVAALGGVGSVAAHPKGAGADQDTPPSETPDGPGPLGAVELDGATEAVVSDETTVFLATTDGFAVVDTTDPRDPTVAYRTDDVLGDHERGPMAGIWDVKVAGDRLLVVGPANPGHDCVHGAAVFDVSDPADPRREAVYETDSPIHNAYLTDGVAYLTCNGDEGKPLVTVDPASGEELGRWSLFDVDDAWRDVDGPLRTLHDVWVRDDRAYLAHWDAGTWILDVSDPASPTFLSRVRGRAAEELAAVEAASREATELPGNDHFVTVDESGSLLGVGLEAWAADPDAGQGPGGLLLFDVSDPTDPVARSRIAPPPTPAPSRRGVWTTAHNFAFVDDRLYSAWYQGGVKVHDVSDPSDPRELFHWRDADRAKFWTAQLGVPGEFFVASSWANPGRELGPGGLFTFPDPERSDGHATGTDDASVDAANDGRRWLAGLGAAAVGVGAWRARR